MTKPILRPLTRRAFWPMAAGMFSLVVGCSRQRATLKSQAGLSPAEIRSITHMMGTTQVPKAPQRIIALGGLSELEALLVLGIQPFAAAGDDRGLRTVWQPHMKDQLQGVKMLPSRRNISLERLAALQPDLMLATSSQFQGNIYPQLSQIAPTVVLEHRQFWQENLRLIAQIVNQTEQAETWISAFEQRLATLANTYGEALAGTTYTMAFYFPDQRQFELMEGDDLDLAVRQIGLERPLEQSKLIDERGGDARRFRISLERLDLIDTDILFIYYYQYPTIKKASELPELNRFLEEEPVLRRLRAVQTDHVFMVPAYYWFHGGAMGLPLAIDDLAAEVLPLFT
ncbi:MAG: iron-siderophore ABC transporter substrate-binding protein [Cyanobacteria bacterium P01_D01_bin.71]